MGIQPDDTIISSEEEMSKNRKCLLGTLIQNHSRRKFFLEYTTCNEFDQETPSLPKMVKSQTDR